MSNENFRESHKGDILVVEDFISNLKYLGQILKKAGYQVRSANDGESALDSVQETNPDLILLDITLPGIDGIEVCAQLKSNPETSEIPIIFLSAFNKSEMKVEAFKAGGIDYITKPIESAEILVRIETHLKMNRLQKELKHKSELLKEEIAERLRSEEDLIKERIMLKTIIDNIPIMLTRYSPDTKMLYLNKEYENIIGWKTEEVQDIDLMKKVYPDPDYRQQATEHMQLANSEWREFKVKSKAGKIMDSEWSNIRLEDGTQIGIGIDITERKEAVEALKNSEEKLKIVFDFAPDAYYLSDIKGTFLDGNKAAEELMGYKKEELIGKSFLNLKLLSAKEFLKASKLLLKNVQGKGTGPDEFILNSKDGTEVPVEIRTYPVQIKDKTVVLGIAHDLTERKLAEVELKRSEEQLSAFMESATDGIVMYDSKMNLIRINKKAMEFFPIKSRKEDFVGKNALEFFPDLVKTDRYERYLKIIETGKPFLFDDFQVHANLGKRYLSVRAFKVGEGLGIINTDITERKKTEEKMERFSRIFEETLNEIFLFNADTFKFTHANSSAQNNLGYSMEELLNLTPYHIKYKITKKVFISLVEPLLKGEKEKIIFETIHQRKDQSFYKVEVHLQLLEFKHEKLFASIVLDITERKNAETALKESENRFRNLVEQAIDIMFLSDFKGNIIDVNNTTCDKLGYTREELISMNLINLDTLYMDADKQKIIFSKLILEGAVQIESELIRKNGKYIPVEIRVGIIEIEGKKVMLGFARDITRRKKREVKIQEQFKELNKMNKFFINRENKMIDLKKEINDLLEKQGKFLKYNIPG